MNIKRFVPDKVKIFLFGMWLCAYMLFQFSRFINFTLGMIISYSPNYILPSINKTPVRILKALDMNGNEVTNKLKLFMNYKWDNSMFGDHGGIDLDPFFNYIGSACVWVAYIFEYDIDDIANLEFMENINEGASVALLKKCIRFILIDANKKIMKKVNKETQDITREDILFGEVDFE